MLKALLPSRTQIISALVCLAVQYGPVALAAAPAVEPAKADSATPRILRAADRRSGRDVPQDQGEQDPVPRQQYHAARAGTAIGWLGNWGMAASTKDNDYVHLVLKAIAETAGREPQSVVANIADFRKTVRNLRR